MVIKRSKRMSQSKTRSEIKSKPTKAGHPELLHKSKSAWEGLAPKTLAAVEEYARHYMEFLSQAKTERECVHVIERQLRQQGFKPLVNMPKLKKGDKVFKNIKGRALMAAVIGNVDKPWRLVAAHVDSPRLDLKPYPLFEEGNLAMFQTHYYGGIKKYQWVNVPLSMHAVVHTHQGTKIFTIGEKNGEPQFIIPDMPPHLGREQMAKSARDAIKGEQLRIIVGNSPLRGSKEKEKVKMAVLDWLQRNYGMVERDLISADITFVPAAGPVVVGFDQACIAAYGQDDRACVHATLAALLRVQRPQGVALGLFMDKEEIGSYGDTAAQSRMLDIFAAEIQRKAGAFQSPAELLEHATAISADVTEALNPNFSEISDPRNSSRMGQGVSVEKYGGGGGKDSTNEASGEYMNWLLRSLDKAGIKWQSGEFGRLDLGGGGTIAMYLSRYGMDTIDAGPPLLSMHSTQEVSSKVDVYFTFQCYLHFLQA